MKEIVLTCINDRFENLPPAFRGRKLPKILSNYRVSYQVVDDGELFVELTDLPGLMFNMNKHFFVAYDSDIDKNIFNN